MKSQPGRFLIVILCLFFFWGLTSSKIIKLSDQHIQALLNKEMWFSGDFGLGTSGHAGESDGRVYFQYVEFNWDRNELLLLGKVSDRHTEEPLPAAFITITGYSDSIQQIRKETQTDIGGNFQIRSSVEPGDILFMRCIGYIGPVYNIGELLYNTSVTEDTLTMKKRKVHGSFEEALKTPEDVYAIYIGYHESQHIPPEIKQLTNLTSLVLRVNNLTNTSDSFVKTSQYSYLMNT